MVDPSLEEILVVSERLLLMTNFSQKDMYDAFWSLHIIGLAVKCLHRVFRTTRRKCL